MASVWLESMDVPAQPEARDLMAFFGIPPDPEDKLDANIAKKRRHWSSKVRQRVASEKAKRKVEEATRIIDELEKLLKRGVIDEDFDLERLREEFSAEPETHVDELGDLWRILEELVAGGRLEEALRVANDARSRFQGAAAANAAFGWLAMISSRSGDSANDVLRREGLAALEAAIAAGEANSDTFTWKAVLQLDLETPEAALETFAEAEKVLQSGLTPWMHSHRCEARAALGEPEAALEDAKRAVDPKTEDLALRSNTVTALINAARVGLLPIASDADLKRYQDLIEWAAWFAVGVPEAEDRVRPYRLWAVEAESRAYTGRPDMRTIVAVASGFLALPLLNRMRTKPHWKVLRDGPGPSNGEMFEVVTMAGIPLYVHDGLLQKLPWYAEFASTERASQ
jgi:tetratricopeptide (TPR) repeat protein